MRVLHLYAGNLFGGVEAMLVTLAREAAAGPAMEPHFGLAWADGRLGEALRAVSPGSLHPLGAARLRNPLAVRHARARLAATLRALRPDVVICHSAWAHAVFGPAVRRAGLPLVFWLHDAAGATPAERLAARVRADAAVCTSRYVAGTLPRLHTGIPTRVIHPPVPAPAASRDGDRDRVRAELGARSDDAVLIQVGRMEPWKGQEVLLRALGRLREVPGWRCWMVGGAQRPEEARYADRLRQIADAEGVASRVAWLGERRDVRALLAAADVAVQPSARPEPFGMAMVEALYAGVPVVAADHGGAPEVVDAGCGVRVAPGDDGALAGALGELVRDPALRGRLGRAGPARAAHLCAPQARLAELADFLRPLASGSAG